MNKLINEKTMAFLKLGFTPLKAEQLLEDMEIQKRMERRKPYRKGV